MTETPETILDWSLKTFGLHSVLSVATRASKEVNELVCAVLNDAPLAAIHEEIADCAIMMWQVAGLKNLDHRPALRQMTNPEEVNKGIAALMIQRRFTSVLDELVKAQNPSKFPELAQAHSMGILRDSLICLEFLAWAYGIDLQEHVDGKMVINRSRSWEKLQNGGYQHVAAAVVA